MKRNKLFILGIVTVLVALLSLTLVSGTYAKYTSTATGSDSARVAKWLVKVENTNIAVNPSTTFTVDLFGSLKEADTTTAETHVAAANGSDKIIAPGTGGQFELNLENNSEVDAEYTIGYVLTNGGNVPLEFSIDGGSTWTTSLANVSATAIAKNGGTDSVTVQWRWAFTGAQSSNFTSSQTDGSDTDLGIAGTATVTVAITVTFTQVD